MLGYDDEYSGTRLDILLMDLELLLARSRELGADTIVDNIVQKNRAAAEISYFQ